MFWFVLGLPSRFASWCNTVVAELAGGDAGPELLIAANTLEQLASRVLQAGVSRAVIFAPQPESALREALAAAERPHLVTLGDPRTALIELAVGRGVGLAEAVQTVAGSCAAFSGDIAAPGALVLDPAVDAADLSATAAAIAEHFAFAASDDQLARLTAAYAAASAHSTEDAVRWWNGLGAAGQRTVSGALAAYAERSSERALLSATPLSVTWHHELFFRGARPGERVDGPVDITGRAHCLIEGPYILLPPGTWALSLSLFFSRETAEREFAVEVLTDRQLASGNMRPLHEGASVLHLEFTVDEKAQHPVSIRVSSLRAAFDGQIAVEAAMLVRLPSEASEPPAPC